MTDHPVIEATGLTKSYGSITVLGGVGLRVAPGSVFSLLGPTAAPEKALPLRCPYMTGVWERP